MSPEEKADLVMMKEKQKEVQEQTFRIMRAYAMGTEVEIKLAGHKSIPSALMFMMQRCIAEEKKLIDAHLKKYPD